MAKGLLTRITAAMLTGSAMCAPAGAQAGAGTDSATVQALLACREIAESAARAACMETRLDEFAAALDEGRLVVVERTRMRTVERESFGISLPSMSALGDVFGGRESRPVAETETLDDGTTVVYRAGGGVDEMRGVPVRSVDTNPYGKIAVTLENGQVWVQTDDTRLRRVRSRHMDGLTADIRSGLFGSTSMELSHSGPSFKVERLR